MEKFNVGDIVKVANSGIGYTTYSSWFKQFAPEYLSRYNGNLIYEGLIGEIVAIAPHGERGISYDTLIAIKTKYNNVVLIGFNGIELIEATNKFVLKGR